MDRLGTVTKSCDMSCMCGDCDVSDWIPNLNWFLHTWFMPSNTLVIFNVCVTTPPTYISQHVAQWCVCCVCRRILACACNKNCKRRSLPVFNIRNQNMCFHSVCANLLRIQYNQKRRHYFTEAKSISSTNNTPEDNVLTRGTERLHSQSRKMRIVFSLLVLRAENAIMGADQHVA